MIQKTESLYVKFYIVGMTHVPKSSEKHWEKLPSEDVIEKTADAIRERGIEVIIVDSKREALGKIINMIPRGAEVFHGSSVTLREIGFLDYLRSGKHEWIYLNDEILKEASQEARQERRRKALLAEYFLASVNAITQSGELVACDQSGSRVGAFPFAAKKLILIAGVHKITSTLNEAMRRVKEYAYPLEDERAMGAYGMHSLMGKWIIIEREISLGRITLILVKEKLGF